ncbi:spermatogenesis-associated protein 7 [Phyllobates terribilis]|uniref:spermatogenesis-associated protein 7 n=1 Tax=Phyllobates terribilis TaxID=111132 RepID=UPI003CCA97BC
MSPGHRAAPEGATNPGGGNGGARAVAGSRTPSIPRCGVSSPFRGHLSTKSNAFCIGQSSRLSDQYRIRDHMLIHYNKILSAKAAVDCSVPKSLIKSVKYSDQQRRERMKKEVAQLERTSSPYATASRPRSRDGADSVIFRKDYNDPHSPLLRHSPYSDPGPIYSPSSFISSPRHLQSTGHTGKPHERHPEFWRLHSGLSDATAWTSPCKFQDNQTKTYNGDLLDKHSHHFTTKERPFTPRTLKTKAKSALAQSRYYTPPRRKRRGTAAGTETDISSFRHVLRTPERDSSPIRDLESNNENLLLSDEDEDLPEERLRRSLSSELKLKSSSIWKIRSEEEELSYLNFVADVTTEILTLGLFSDRVVERVFERHLEGNRHRLDEAKMRHLLDMLRSDLDCREETNPQSVVRNLRPKRTLTNSSWGEVLNGSSQEEAAVMTGSSQEEAAVLTGSSQEEAAVLTGSSQEEAAVLNGSSQEEAAVLNGSSQEEAAVMTGSSQEEAAVMTGSSQEEAAVMTGSSQEEAASDLHGLVSDHHLLVDSAAYLEEDDVHSDVGARGTEHGDCVPLATDDPDGDHHHEDEGGDRLSPDHDGYDVQETAADDRTDQPSDNTFTSSFKDISNNADDLETMEELQQSFSDVIQVSRGKDCDVSDPGEADETNNRTEF